MHELIQSIQTTTTIHALQNIMIEIVKKLSYDFIIYNIRITNSFKDDMFIALGNYPKAWLKQYTLQNYASIDPVLKYCLEKDKPICWHHFHDSHNTILCNFFQEAKSFGLVDGISKGVQKSQSEIGIISLAKKSICKADSDAIETIKLLQPTLHEVIIRLSKRYKESKKVLLTPRELESLHLMIEGYTSVEIANLLNIAERTAIFHINNIIEKLDAKNRTQAVARAILIGLVNPDDYRNKREHRYHWKDI